MAGLTWAHDNCQIDVDAEFDSHTQSLFDAMAAAFNSLAASARTWQETERRATDMFYERTRARESVTRVPVRFGFKNIDLLKSSHDAIFFGAARGPEVFVYPGFVLVRDRTSRSACWVWPT